MIEQLKRWWRTENHDRGNTGDKPVVSSSKITLIDRNTGEVADSFSYAFFMGFDESIQDLTARYSADYEIRIEIVFK